MLVFTTYLLVFSDSSCLFVDESMRIVTSHHLLHRTQMYYDKKIYERARRHTHTPTRTVGKTPTRLILNEPAHGYSVVSSILTPESSNYSNNSIKITSAFWAEYELHTDTNPRALRRKTEPGGRYPCPIYMISNIDKDVLDWAPERTAITEMLQITYYEFHIIGEEKKEGQRREN